MIGEEVYIHPTVCGFSVHREREGGRVSVYLDVQEQKHVVLLPLHSELCRGSKVVQAVKERREGIKVVRPEGEDVVDVAKPKGRAGIKGRKKVGLYVTHPQSCEYRREWRSHSDPENLRVESPMERERVRVDTEADEFEKDVRRDRRRDHALFHLPFNVEENLIKWNVGE